MDELSDILRQEERKRLRRWDPKERWSVIQRTITWAESQVSSARNTPAARAREQSRKLEVFENRRTTLINMRPVAKLDGGS